MTDKTSDDGRPDGETPSARPAVIVPQREDNFFVGWAGKPVAFDRRFLLGLGAGFVAAGAVTGVGLASQQSGYAPGIWDQGDVRDFVGELIGEPYPALRVAAQYHSDGTLSAVGGFARAALLGCSGKCGVQSRLEAAVAASDAGLISVRGSLIVRGDHRMIAVIDGPDWVRPATPAEAEGAMSVRVGFDVPQDEEVGFISLTGEIVDAKCWFGAMRPNEGKGHKACAALCIASGLPPAFVARGRMGREALYLLTGPAGEPLTHEILALVADPVRASGRIVRRDFIEFRVDPAEIVRL